VILLDDWGDYKPPRAATRVGKLTGDALASYEQSLRVTNTIHRLEHEPSALGDEEQLGLLSNTIWKLNLTRI
jgi:hypothetical protein